MNLFKMLQNIIFWLVFSYSSYVIALPDHISILEQRELPNHLGNYTHSQVTPSGTYTSIDFYVAELSDHHQARLYLQPVADQSQAKLLGNLNSVQDFTIAINGGYYTPEFQPVGLLIDQYKKITRFKKNRLLTSCVAIDQKGRMSLIPRCLEAPNAFYVMQTGPVIMDHGNSVNDISDLQANSKVPPSYFNPHARTILAETADKKLLVIVTSPMSMGQELAILKNDAQAFGTKQIESAINSDGGASTGMYIRFKDNPVYIGERKPVKVVVFIH